MRAALIWGGLAVSVIVPVLLAAQSPFLQWREPIYIGAGFAGVIAMAVLLLQPLLAGGYLPGLPPQRGRPMHRALGFCLVAMIVLHVAGLWITSPPDVIDALLFVSPTPFSVWGVLAMWAVFAAALLAAFRKRVPLRVWRRGHTGLVMVVVVGSVVHALLIEGTMETVSKVALCCLVVVATWKVMTDLNVRSLWTKLR